MEFGLFMFGLLMIGLQLLVHLAKSKGSAEASIKQKLEPRPEKKHQLPQHHLLLKAPLFFSYRWAGGREQLEERFPEPTSFGKYVSRQEALRRLFFTWSGISRKAIQSRFAELNLYQLLQEHQISWSSHTDQNQFVQDFVMKLELFAQLHQEEKARGAMIGDLQGWSLEADNPLFTADPILTLELYYASMAYCPISRELWLENRMRWSNRLLAYVLCRWPASLPEELLPQAHLGLEFATEEQLNLLLSQPRSQAVTDFLWSQLAHIRRPQAKLLLKSLMLEDWVDYVPDCLMPWLLEDPAYREKMLPVYLRSGLPEAIALLRPYSHDPTVSQALKTFDERVRGSLSASEEIHGEISEIADNESNEEWSN
jgi:hypothetical protein